MFYLDLNEADFLKKHMLLLARDTNFPCQPELEYANVTYEDGVIWADINPNSLPNYLSIKSRYKVINKIGRAHV